MLNADNINTVHVSRRKEDTWKEMCSILCTAELEIMDAKLRFLIVSWFFMHLLFRCFFVVVVVIIVVFKSSQ